MGIHFKKIDTQNITIYHNLAQAYEAEFSNLTNKMPDTFGIFYPDTLPIAPNIGYFLYLDNHPVGFGIASISSVNEILEFYIAPIARRKGLGQLLAQMFFKKFPGKWQIKQIEGAQKATLFWQKIIKQYTKNQFQETKIQDETWGQVTQQTFHTKDLNKK